MTNRKKIMMFWLKDFIGTAQANEEFEIKLTTLVRILRGEARLQKEDHDVWLEDFIMTAQANGEFDIKLTTLASFLEEKQDLGSMVYLMSPRLIGMPSK